MSRYVDIEGLVNADFTRTRRRKTLRRVGPGCAAVLPPTFSLVLKPRKGLSKETFSSFSKLLCHLSITESTLESIPPARVLLVRHKTKTAQNRRRSKLLARTEEVCG